MTTSATGSLTRSLRSRVRLFSKRKATEILFDKTLLGLSQSQQALLNTVWLSNMIHFDLCGCKEQKELCWGDIVLKTDSDGCSGQI